jgi:DNA-binding IclR family transcriptional regulator
MSGKRAASEVEAMPPTVRGAEVLGYLRDVEEASTKDVAEALGYPYATAWRILWRLCLSRRLGVTNIDGKWSIVALEK